MIEQLSPFPRTFIMNSANPNRRETSVVVNLNVRVLGNGHIFVQYQEDGKARDAGFPHWFAFLDWLRIKVSGEATDTDGRGAI